MRGTHFRHLTTALLASLCVAACATSNYAPVVYHDNTKATGGAPIVSMGDPASDMRSRSAPGMVAPVQSEALGATVESLPPPSGARSSPSYVEAEQPHSLAPPDARYAVTTAEQQRVASAPPIQLETRPLVIAPSAPVPLGREQSYDVVVQPGDTLYSLSRAHNADRNAIIAANNLQAPYGLRLGERLVIPKGEGITAASAPLQAAPAPVRVVQPGDTLYSIARAERADVRAIALANNLEPPYALRSGQSLTIPRSTMIASAAGSAGGPFLRMGESPVPPANAPRERVKPPAAHDASLANIARTPFIWPVSGKIISTFGPKDAGRRNDGLNIAAPVGTAVHAARSGEVIYVGNELRGYGNLVLIRHDDGYVSAYAHNSRILVQRGSAVSQGQQIAESGESGSVTEPQVHFEIRKDRHPIDPLGYLPKV